MSHYYGDDCQPPHADPDAAVPPAPAVADGRLTAAELDTMIDAGAYVLLDMHSVLVALTELRELR